MPITTVQHTTLSAGIPLAEAGVGFSPRNPTGPVCHAASLHICAAAGAVDRLEVQFDKTPLFSALVGGGLPTAADGASTLPKGTGLGVRYPQTCWRACTSTGWTSGPSSRPLSQP